MMASFSVWPVGSRPSVSSVNEMATGICAAFAAKARPAASLTFVMVIAVTMSASVVQGDNGKTLDMFPVG